MRVGPEVGGPPHLHRQERVDAVPLGPLEGTSSTHQSVLVLLNTYRYSTVVYRKGFGILAAQQCQNIPGCISINIISRVEKENRENQPQRNAALCNKVFYCFPLRERIMTCKLHAFPPLLCYRCYPWNPRLAYVELLWS